MLCEFISGYSLIDFPDESLDRSLLVLEYHAKGFLHPDSNYIEPLFEMFVKRVSLHRG